MVTPAPYGNVLIPVNVDKEIVCWVIDPEDDNVIDVTGRVFQVPFLVPDGNTVFTVEESVTLSVEENELRHDVGWLVRVPFSGLQTIDRFLDAFLRVFDVYIGLPVADRPMPRVLHGVMGELDLWDATDYIFPPRVIDHNTPNPDAVNVRQVDARQITTDGEFYRWMQDTDANQVTRYMRVILHRLNRGLDPAVADPIENSPILNPREADGGPPPLYLPEPSVEIFDRCRNPMLPYRAQPPRG